MASQNTSRWPPTVAYEWTQNSGSKFIWLQRRASSPFRNLTKVIWGVAILHSGGILRASIKCNILQSWKRSFRAGTSNIDGKPILGPSLGDSCWKNCKCFSRESTCLGMTQGRTGIHTMNPGGRKAEKYAYKDQRARNGKHTKNLPSGQAASPQVKRLL